MIFYQISGIFGVMLTLGRIFCSFLLGFAHTGRTPIQPYDVYSFCSSFSDFIFIDLWGCPKAIFKYKQVLAVFIWVNKDLWVVWWFSLDPHIRWSTLFRCHIRCIFWSVSCQWVRCKLVYQLDSFSGKAESRLLNLLNKFLVSLSKYLFELFCKVLPDLFL